MSSFRSAALTSVASNRATQNTSDFNSASRNEKGPSRGLMTSVDQVALSVAVQFSVSPLAMARDPGDWNIAPEYRTPVVPPFVLLV